MQPLIATQQPRALNPWLFVPTLYFMQTVPNSVVNDVLPIILKDAHLTNVQITSMVSIVSLPWSLKLLWAPIVDALSTTRRWVLATQLAGAVTLAAIALGLFAHLPLGNWLTAALILLAVCSATYDIAADGLYIASLSAKQLKSLTGILTISARLAKFAISGGFVFVIGRLTPKDADPLPAWAWGLTALSALQILTSLWHTHALPHPPPHTAHTPADTPAWARLHHGLVDFFTQPALLGVLAFIALYRLGEAMLGAIIALFLKDTAAAGGLALPTDAVGAINGIAGVSGLLAGGLFGGWFLARLGIRRALWPMALCMHLPNILFVWAAYSHASELWMYPITFIEKLGYGFGFSGYMVVLMSRARLSKHSTAYYAVATSLGALVITAATAASGYLQQRFGYPGYFLLVCLLTVPGMATLFFVPTDEPATTATTAPPDPEL